MTEFDRLIEFLDSLPAISRFEHPVPPNYGMGRFEDGNWWIKFQIDIEDELAWDIVQLLAFVANGAALNDPFPTQFFPSAPPPENGGGPKELLAWVVESTDPKFTPDEFRDALSFYIPTEREDIIELRKESVVDFNS